MTESLRCYRHPKRETRISCASCGRPICTDCMVQTDVGIKCPECARLPRGARAGAMRPDQLVKSLLAGLLVAAVGPLVVFAIFQVGLLSFMLSAAAGFGAGTLVYRAGGRNGGPVSVAISAASTFIAYIPFLLPPILAGTVPVQYLLPALLAAVFAGLANRKFY